MEKKSIEITNKNMEAILLKVSDPEKDQNDLVVFDEAIKGMVSQELFVPVFTGSTEGGLRFYPMSYLIDNYKFPEKPNGSRPMITLYVSEKLRKHIEFYTDDRFNIQPI